MGGTWFQRAQPVVEAQVQRAVDGERHQGQRVVGGVPARHGGDPEAVGGAREGGRIQGVVLEHQVGVEQLSAPDRALDPAQPDVVVRQQPGLFIPQPAQGLAPGLRAVEAHAHRHRVDEQTDHRTHPG